MSDEKTPTNRDGSFVEQQPNVLGQGRPSVEEPGILGAGREVLAQRIVAAVAKWLDTVNDFREEWEVVRDELAKEAST